MSIKSELLKPKFTVTVFYDNGKGERVSKVFADIHKAKRFYGQCLKSGLNPELKAEQR